MPNPSTETAENHLERLLRFLEKDATNSNLLTDAADAALQAQKPNVARDMLERAAGIAPLSAHQRSLEGLAAIQLADFPRAIAIFSALDGESPDTPAIRFNLAWSHAMAGEFEKAAAALDAKTATALPQAATLRVQTLHQLGKIDEASDAAREYIKLFPARHDLAAAVSVLAVDIEDLDLARRMSAIAGDHPDGLTTQGTLALTDSRPTEAKSLFQQALKANQELPRAWVGLGLTEMLSGDNLRAAQDIERGAGLFGDHIGSWIAAGWARLFAGDLAAARKNFDTAMAIDHNFGETHGSLAVLAVLEGDVDGARRSAATAMRLDRQSFSAALATAMIAASTGSKERARAILDRALATPISGDGRTLAQVLAANGLRI